MAYNLIALFVTVAVLVTAVLLYFMILLCYRRYDTQQHQQSQEPALLEEIKVDE